MIDAHMERLLGGYATDTLTDAERATLFQAALEDQELFNALQDEEALRDLLQDVESRRLIEAALKQPAPEPRKQWWIMPAWAWGLTASAVAASALMFALLHQRTTNYGQVQVAVAKPDVKVLRSDMPSQADKPAERRHKSAESRTAALPKATPAASKRAEAEQSTAPASSQIANTEAQQAIAQAPQARAVDSASGQPAAAPAPASFTGTRAAGYLAASRVNLGLSYSVLKRAADGSFAPMFPGEPLRTGDSVKLVVHPPVAGSLIMQQQTPGGNWKNIFPGPDSGLPVTAQQDVVIPDSPIQVTAPQELRLILTPGQIPVATALSRAGKLAINESKNRLESNHTAADIPALQRPFTIDLTLAPGKASPDTSPNR